MLQKQVADITSELDSEQKERESAVADMWEMEGDTKTMKQVNNTLCVAEETKDELLTTNHEAERKGKALIWVI